jgi:hypothetical protein
VLKRRFKPSTSGVPMTIDTTQPPRYEIQKESSGMIKRKPQAITIAPTIVRIDSIIVISST